MQNIYLELAGKSKQRNEKKKKRKEPELLHNNSKTNKTH